MDLTRGKKRKATVEIVEEMVEMMVNKYPALSLEKYHQILNSTKEMLTLMSLNNALRKPSE